MGALVGVCWGRRVQDVGGKGARIDIRVACVLCLASGEGDKGGRGGGAVPYNHLTLPTSLRLYDIVAWVSFSRSDERYA